MKKYLIASIFLLVSFAAFAIEEPYSANIGQNWEFRAFSLNHLYKGYLADPLAVRMETSVQNTLYADYDFQDTVNDDGLYTGRLSIYPGVRLSLLQFTNKKKSFGIEGEIGFMAPVYMRNGNNDLIGVDGIYYFRINSQITSWLSVNFSKHHICTHLGDEYVTGKVESPTNYDPNRMQLPVLDDFRLAATVRPLFFLGIPQLDILSLYGEIAWFAPGSDFLGERISKPDRWAYLNYQIGAELEYYFPGWGKHVGGLFTAFNISAYQQNGYATNFSFNAGWILPQDRNARRLRVGFQYYNGRSLINQFYNHREKFWAIYLAADV